MADTLTVESRTEMGTTASRRLRKAGKIPAVLYGHGLDNAILTVSSDEIAAAIRHGSRMVQLTGAVKDSAFIKEIHWDAFGVDILHLDLTRVSMDESIEVTVAIELRGEAPGLKRGGVVEMLVHEVEIECRASEIPDKLELSVNSLDVDGSLTAAELQLPAGAKLLSDVDQVIVHCMAALVEEEEEEVAGEGAEPEVIGREEGEEEESAG